MSAHWILLLSLLLFYLIFAAAPAVVMFCTIFHHRTERVGEKDYYRPHKEAIAAANACLDAHPSVAWSLTADDGVTLVADYHEIGSPRTVLFFHGYRALPRANCAVQAATLLGAGYNVLLIHERAHGKSGGKDCTLGAYESRDVLAWVARASQEATVEHLYLYGVSMGAVAIGLASDRLSGCDKVRALALDCGFVSIRRQLATDSKKLHIPPVAVLPVLSLLFRLRYRADIRESTVDHLANATLPVLFLHGEADESVPFSDAREAYAACASEKESYFRPESLHTCVFLDGGAEAKAVLLNFYERCTRTEASQHIR